jgi:hypothetical protein
MEYRYINIIWFQVRFWEIYIWPFCYFFVGWVVYLAYRRTNIKSWLT